MKKNILRMFSIALILVYMHGDLRAQNETPRFEVGAQFSSLTIQQPEGEDFEIGAPPDGSGAALVFITTGSGFPRAFRTEPGVGGRFSVNLTPDLALETQADIYPNDDGSRTSFTGGRTFQLVAGVKAGKRFDRFGVFGKARPGFVRFSRVLGDDRILPTGGTGGVPLSASDDTAKATAFAFDLGGVLEFYPSRRIVTRFDIGDTVIRYPDRTRNVFGVTALSPAVPVPVTFEGETKHNFQFSAGIGFRF